MILKGNPVSRGIVIGKALIYKPFAVNVQERIFEKGEEERMKESFDLAVEKADAELNSIALSFGDDEKGKIFAAHKEILHDEEIQEMISEAILSERKMPDYAAMEVFEEFIELIGKTDDPLIAARAADFKDVRNRLIRTIHGAEEKNLSHLANPVIVVAHDLFPSDTATLDRDHVIGIITEIGSKTSHSAIIANSYSIPAVLGVTSCTQVLKDGQMIGVDALTGEIYIEPDETEKDLLNKKSKEFIKQMEAERLYLDKPFVTSDGIRLQMGINIGGVENSSGYEYSDFVGLFRTEFLYMESDHMPDESEQFEAYTKVLRNANGKPVTLRTLDIGGDKTLGYMDLPKEDNPFLGKRALRLCLENPDIFRTQLRAALRASIHGPLQIMLPMVGSVEDICRGREAVDSVRAELNKEGIPVGDDVKFGIMIEIPAIAVIADLVSEMVDFASIGTNDLCQYLHAVDRMNPGLEPYYQPLSPAMVRTLSHISDAFSKAGKSLSVCGELAGDVRGALLMAGLGIKKLSMSESNFARVKAAMALVPMTKLIETAHEALEKKTQGEIVDLMNSLIKHKA